MLWIESKNKENADWNVPLHQMATAPREYNYYSRTLNMEVPCIEFVLTGGQVIEWRYSPEEIKHYFNRSERNTLVETLTKQRDEEYTRILALLASNNFPEGSPAKTAPTAI